jgi:anti-sigma factor RsiW
MACEQFESQILDYLENQLPPADRSLVEQHLAGCSRCKAFARELRRLDTALAGSLKAPVLSSSFSGRLRERIRTEAPAPLPEARRAERKRQLEAEFEAGLARFRHQSFGWAALIYGLGNALLAALAGCAVLGMVFLWPNLPRQLGLGRFGQSLLLSCLPAVVFLLVGLAAAFPQRLKRFWVGL